MVNHVDAAELHIVVAAVLTAAADALLAAQLLPELAAKCARAYFTSK
jgi:hypothetical protein